MLYNCQETFEIAREVRRLGNESLSDIKAINLSDSAVGLGVLAKGRSSSFRLNGISRKVLIWSLFTRKMLYNVHIRGVWNPGDAPSRFKDVHSREGIQEAPEWLLPHLAYGPVPANVLPPPPIRFRLFREGFAGKAGLSLAWRDSGLPVGKPIECFNQGNYMRDQDMERLPVIENIERDILSGYILYMHFGIVCRSWGPASRFQPARSRSSRTRENPLGSGLRSVEVQGNTHAAHVARLCSALVKVGGKFSIENPKGSYVFLHPDIGALSNLCETVFVDFDQCAYGLQLAGAGEHFYARKRTTIFTNCLELKMLERRCPGISATHKHDHCWGARVVNGKSVRLTSSAAHYPKELCKSFAAACHECRQNLSQ